MRTYEMLATELDIEIGLIQETVYDICIASGDDFHADHEAFFAFPAGRIDFGGVEITEGLAGRVRDAIEVAAHSVRCPDCGWWGDVRCPDCGWWCDDRNACDVCANGGDDE